MVQSNFETKVKIQEIIDNQIPEFLVEENPKFVEFLRQYYISQENQGSSVDIVENISEYLKLDNLTIDVISPSVSLTQEVVISDSTIYVNSTKGFPKNYGLLKIDEEIITYKEKTENSFIGCIRGFSGIESYENNLIFSSTESSSHINGSVVSNLSVLFLQKFYEKVKGTFLPGLEQVDLYQQLNVNNFIKNSKSFYQAKGSKESFRILFNALYGITPIIVDLEEFLFKSSGSSYRKRKELLFENLTPERDPLLISGYQVTKETDSSVFGSVSEAEIFTRSGKTYYKFYIFLGYDDTNSESNGEFSVTPSTRVVEKVNSLNNSTSLTVDSTIGFEKSGNINCNGIKIYYTDKSVNQFFGCYTEGSNFINANIDKTTAVYSNDTYYGYENGDETKKVSLRLLGTIVDISIDNDNDSTYIFSEGDKIGVKSLGTSIKNPLSNKKQSEIIANSLIYNTSSRYQLESFNSNSVITLSPIDKSSLKPGDKVEFLERNTEILANDLSDVTVNSINLSTGEIRFDANLSSLNSLKKYDIRRKIKTSSSEFISLKYDNITCDTTNCYIENNENLYITSNSLPSYQISKKLFSYNADGLSEYDSNTERYSTIRFSEKISFLTGDRVYYSYNDVSIPELKNDFYYVKVSDDKKGIKLYTSRSFIAEDLFIELSSIPDGLHNFTLFEQTTEDSKIYPAKLLKKINTVVNTTDENKDSIGSRTIGILVNGVEISSYKSLDKIYYGPLTSVDVINPGKGYDVINAPKLELSYGNAKVQPILQGSIEKVYVDPQEFNIERPITLSITGGNGKGAVLSPITRLKSRDVFFDARRLDDGGGLSIDSETITFLTPHNFFDGQKIIYDINNINNSRIGIGPYLGSNDGSQRYLGNNSTFYAKVINDKTIRIYPSYGDFVSGINTIGFNTEGNSGIHKFKTEPKKVLDSIKVINGGEGFTNRKLIVKPTGISTFNHTINFKNHGFSTGELVTYDYETSSISGLSTSNQYYVLKVDGDSFRVCNAGIAGTDLSNYQRENYIKLSSSGSGYQYFSYPPITLDVSYVLSDGQTIKKINATPVVKGSIIDSYLYETGSDYGSEILNLENVPTVKILQGTLAELTPVISAGRIVKVLISYYGSEYYSVPELVVESKSGVGAILRAEILNGRVESVIILNEGYGYDPDDTTIKVVSSGSEALLLPKIRSLTVDNCYKYGTEYDVPGRLREPSYEIVQKNAFENLQYTISGYSDLLKDLFNQQQNTHSSIIGWSYDGIPIYGPYGYSEPDNTSTVKLLNSGYTLDTTKVENRISTDLFPAGYFVEDYQFTNSGDLDEYNGRFCKTPEYPNGAYVYFATAKINADQKYIGAFPYFIGNYYRGKLISSNVDPFFNQNFDFNNSNLKRNTLPYKSGQVYGRNDFIPYNINQSVEVTNVLPGKIDKVEIIDSGYNYKVGDLLYFDDENTSGYGLEAFVDRIEGEKIDSIQSEIKIYENCKLYTNSNNSFYIKYQPNFDVSKNTLVTISGLTSSFSNLNGVHRSTTIEFNTKLINSITFGGNIDDANPTNVGLAVTDIYLQDFPKRVSIGSSIKIFGESYDQYFKILNYFNDIGALRVARTSSSGLSTANSLVSFLPDVLSISSNVLDKTDQENYIRYFNPTQSIGVGTTPGNFVSKSFYNGNALVNVSIPTQSIYLPNHGFKSYQKVILRRPDSTGAISVSEGGSSAPFNILGSGETQQTLYIINKSKDYIGIATSPEAISTTNGLFFNSENNVGSDTPLYSFETTYDEVLCNVTNITSTVSISTNHNLSKDDEIFINVVPQKNVGIGESSQINLKYNDSIKSILVNNLLFTPNEVNIQTNKLNIVNHGLISGDKVYYISTSIIGGLSTGSYYVHKIDLNNIHLCETYKDSITNPPNIINLTSVGIGTQELSLIQPRIKVSKNNSIVFNVSDTSLEDFKFKLYYDKNLSKEFISTPSSNTFSIVGLGTIGVSTDASITLNYSNQIPEKLYYTLEKNNDLVLRDDTIKDSSEIVFVNSVYTGKYNIFNITNTTFDINLKEVPEENSYSYNDCYALNYNTNSLSASGSVNKINITNFGNSYKNTPSYTFSNSSNGTGLYIIPSSTSIGKIDSLEIKNTGFEYPSDHTIFPSIDTLKIVSLNNSNTLLSVDVVFGGKNYPSAPKLIVIDTVTREIIDRGLLIPTMSGGGQGNSNIESVSIQSSVNGLPKNPVTIISTNNSNGVLIDRVESSTSGIMTCLLKTPILGFVSDPFSVGDEVFVENIENVPGTGLGFNSKDHGYKFFKVINYVTESNPGQIEIQIPELYGNPGVAVTFQVDTFATIVKKDNYPIFRVEQDYSIFLKGEKISILQNDESVLTDLVVEISTENYLKLFGSYELSVGDLIKGSDSGYLATVESISFSEGYFIVGSENIASLDWENEIGKPSNDSQFISDNDYYQNLSYSIKSEKSWDDISSIVNSTVHPIGTKNFADKQISSSASGITSTGLKPSSELSILQTFVSKSRVDTIKNFDFVTDYDVNNNTSRLIKFKNVKLQDYFESRTNRVLQIDDISGEFSSDDDNDKRLDQIILALPQDQYYGKFLIQIKSTDQSSSNELQFTEIISLKDRDNAYFIEKNTISNLYAIGNDDNIFGRKIAEITPIVDDVKNYYFLFTPNDPYDTDYEIKILSSRFLTTLDSESEFTINSSPSSIFTKVVNVSSDETKEILNLDSTKYKTFCSQIHIFNKKTFDANYVEIYGIYDGTNVYYSDYYFDANKNDNFSYGFIGTFGISNENDLITLNYTNESDDSITVRSKTISFDDTYSGIGTYRFKSNRQNDGSERTIIIDSGNTTVSSSSTIFSYDSDLFSSVKSLVKVSIGNTISLHQLTTIHDDQNSILVEYPILLVGNDSGIGTFGSKVNVNDFSVLFNPSNEYNGENIDITYYNESFYTFLDEINLPLPLNQNPLYERVDIAKYFGLNTDNINRLNFKLKYRNIPIFAKTFDPFDTNVLDPVSGTFTIENHFFSTGEKLIYKPKSTFIGLGQSAMGIPDGSITDTGITTNRLPSSVYAIKLSNNQFNIALTQESAISGTGITFTDLGEGNAHMFEMYKKNEKSVITLNNLVQYPLSYSGITHTLSGNDGGIEYDNTFFTLSGIGTIRPTDVLKINDEYMRVENVGIGTSNKGPITFTSGDKNIVKVDRGFVGSSATSHLDGAEVKVFRGSFNIFEDEIYFTHPPRGSIYDLVTKDERNLERSRASFSGRVFLRQDYSTNVIFDDVSSQFNGIGQTFSLQSQGINTVGLGTTSGNGILFINGIYQTPKTQNVSNYNFEIIENESLGISSVVFAGIRNELDEITISESDINQNQLPRGGIIVSLGSTAGKGYAPLVGASVKPVVVDGSITNIISVASTGNPIAFTTVSYDNVNGILDVFTPSIEDLSGLTMVKMVGLGFTCPSNAGIVSYFPSHLDSLNIIGIGTTSFSVRVGTSTLPHYYVGYGTIFPWYEYLNYGSGYREPVSIGISDPNHSGTSANIVASVGAGGTLSFTIQDQGSGYVDPIISISPPIYENLPVIGISRLGIGETTDTGIGLLMNVNIGPSQGITTDPNNVGIGSTLFEVSSFKITRYGYNFRRGDVFKPIGLVTAIGFSEPVEEFKLTVLDTYNDNFASWQFGELDLIDSIQKYQNGKRLSYPLYYNGDLLSFEVNPQNADSQVIDMDSLLVIFVNGILQEPKVAYEFTGGSLVRFLTPPKTNDNVEIYFYRGSRGIDSELVDIFSPIQIGDTVQTYSINSKLDETITQNPRTVFDVNSSTLLETNLYFDQGIDELNEKPIYWTKQKEDIIINDILYSKSRDSLEPQIYPTAKIIKDFSDTDNTIFVDDANLFNYEDELPTEKFNLIIVPEDNQLEVGLITAIVSTTGTIESLDIINPGFGYVGVSAEIKISNPYYGVGIGIGTTATASLSISNGSISNVSIINPGSGYTNTNPPQVIVEYPSREYDECLNANVVSGFNGVIIGIGTTAGIGTDLAIEFTLLSNNGSFGDLSVGYPIYISDTRVGTGLTTIDANENDIVGVSTEYLDNIYYIHGLQPSSGIITCNISNNTNIVGIATTGTIKNPVGKFSWGRISGFSRSSNPISIGVSGYNVSSGLSSYPTIQRRDYGLRNSGAIKKSLIEGT